jgi:hypothetical protein
MTVLHVTTKQSYFPCHKIMLNLTCFSSSFLFLHSGYCSVCYETATAFPLSLIINLNVRDFRLNLLHIFSYIFLSQILNAADYELATIVMHVYIISKQDL